MPTRRQILQYSIAAATLPMLNHVALAKNLSHDMTGFAQPMTNADFQQLITSKLADELSDTATANALAPYLANIGFDWSLPTIAASQINSIVAYAFGNRPNSASGNTSSSGGNQAALPDPGPINELLADAVYAIYKLKQVPIFAQWEIARFLVSKYNMTSSMLYSVEPIINADGTITYLSTDSVAAAIIARVGSASALGNVGVVGHRDHAKRCIQTSFGRKMTAYAVNEVPLPLIYDPLSGQPWTRTRSLYLVHDMYAQLYVAALTAQAQAYPNG